MQDRIGMTIYRSDGRVFKAEGAPGWTVEQSKMENWDAFESTIETADNVLTDGASLVGKRLGTIDRTASIVYFGADKTNLEAQTEAKAFFNPKFTFKVHVTYNGRTRWVEGELSAFQCEMYRGLRIPIITFTMLCMDPYWRDVDGNDRDLTTATPMFGFPFASIIKDGKLYGFSPSVLVFDGKNTVTNEGDVECLYTVKMEFVGEVVNPKFTKDGRFVRIMDTMHAGDIVEIDFQAAPPTVKKNGENVIQKVSRDSSFTGMQLNVGANEVQYSCDNNAQSLMYVSLLHHERYLGV